MTIPEQAVQAAANAAHEELLSMAKQMNVPMEYTQSISVNNYRVMRAALTAAAPHLAAVRVKNLIWTSETPYHMARTSFGGFYCIEAIWNESSFVHVRLSGPLTRDRTFHTVDAAKAAAQADYEARILSALEPSAGRAAVLEEAAQALEAWGDIYGDNAAKCVRALASHPVADKPDEAGAQGEGWLDINNAPQDGTVVDLWCDRLSKRVPNCRWNPDFNIGYPEDGPGFWEQLIGSEWRPSYDENWFSHYRTLPTPPSSEVA